MKKHKKNSGFKIPDNYLERFSDDLLQKLEVGESKANHNPFSIPDDYWNTLEKEVLKKTTENKKPKKSTIRLAPYYAVAASVALIIFLTIGTEKNKTKESDLTFANLEVTELQLYLQEVYLEEPSSELILLIPEEGFRWEAEEVNTLNGENILQYLEDTIEETDEFNIYEDEEL
ncbi:hypothetical protein [Eudoraea chungangensis]|uniref:hypothetical protein n=1 Tax=Eudoraea chungangensis TaxID=1481905 RepID=UPI0023EB3EA3|nr:hypothetical protein [Eudoraea chungangensis]